MLSTRNRQPIGKKVSSSRIWIMFWKFVTFYRHYVAFLRVMCVCVWRWMVHSGLASLSVDSMSILITMSTPFKTNMHVFILFAHQSGMILSWSRLLPPPPLFVASTTFFSDATNHYITPFFSSSIQFNIILLNESRSMAHFNHNVCYSTRCLCQQTIVAKMLAFVLLQPHFSISWFDFSCLASIFTTNCVKKRFTWMCAISFRIAYFYVAKLIEKFHAKRRSRLHEAQFFPFIQFKYGTWRQ